jgi:hypothetical protein
LEGEGHCRGGALRGKGAARQPQQRSFAAQRYVLCPLLCGPAPSVESGNLPTAPYTANRGGRGPAWSNPLFEDNAEFRLGMRLALDKQAEYTLELNVYFLPTDPASTGAEVERQYASPVRRVKSCVGTPVAVKLCLVFTAPAAFARRPAEEGQAAWSCSTALKRIVAVLFFSLEFRCNRPQRSIT